MAREHQSLVAECDDDEQRHRSRTSSSARNSLSPITVSEAESEPTRDSDEASEGNDAEVSADGADRTNADVEAISKAVSDRSLVTSDAALSLSEARTIT